ncbi:holo-ACP synthase [Salinicoccus sp. ID82-1]|uniref:Holo-[acyl-carrier-protein] synthase n=1 Tax=Salinicoccus cyprini TaxID=2493691 RepID=A0A558ASI4_9STAP|nr:MULTISPECIES: holo-ACP synthase [Salinicoccus]MCG1009921.1 holo-ACP synthase [Salinicoccus sp. ID82-1]TVT27219.1 holo-[acyl-carrier-protein] synthase [Salinicoccus cyprini]
MIKGLGTDIIEIERIRSVEGENRRLSKRILAPDEMDVYNRLSDGGRRMEYLAGRFAVKEAYSKALGTGIGGNAAFRDIICLNDESGKPYIQNNPHAHVSISHSKAYVVATVIIED